jgi:eukaryotic-like serine/threonine-protein kinase
MELIKGQTLNDLLQEGPLTLAQALQIVTSIAEALGEAHHQGIVHRDVKPPNIVITERGQVKVLHLLRSILAFRPSLTGLR